jgi:hypothetical protein
MQGQQQLRHFDDLHPVKFLCLFRCFPPLIEDGPESLKQIGIVGAVAQLAGTMRSFGECKERVVSEPNPFFDLVPNPKDISVPRAAIRESRRRPSTVLPQTRAAGLVYFALSMFWRASAHTWRNVSGFMEGIELGPFEESIRRFLLGNEFPADTVILVSVWPTRDILPAAYTPRRGRAHGYHCFNFLIPGLEFKLLTGRQIPRSCEPCARMHPRTS